MKLNPTNLRKLENLGGSSEIRGAGCFTLILIKGNGDTSFEKNATGKDLLVEAYKPDEDTMLLAWNGNYSTDIFLITKADLDKYYRRQKNKPSSTQRHESL